MNQFFGRHLMFNNDQWIPWKAAMDQLTFQKRTCITFIPKETNKECCVCNYEHADKSAPNFLETWDWRKHTKQETTNCYGTLPSSNSPYLRCDIETDLEKLCVVLLGAWDIVVPGLIIRMIGDVDSTPNIKTEKEILQGIADAAVASGAWIITSGYKEESISELAGEVVYDCRMKNPDINLRAIAVGKWGNIHDCHKLESQKAFDQPIMHKGHGRYKLESNHTHYIFFDDGTCDSLDTGEFASNFARQLSCGAKRKIPLITVLAGGTLHSLPSICTDLNNQIPVVVINGCGSLGDLLCKYLKLTENLYQSSYRASRNNTDDKIFSDSEDDMDIAMIDEEFTHDDNQVTTPSTGETLRKILRRLGKCRVDFVDDVRKLYNLMRQEQYEAKGKRLPVGAFLSLDEEKDFAKCLHQLARCLEDPFRQYIHLFNVNLSKSLKETIYYAFIQAKNNFSERKKQYYKTIDEQVHLAFCWGIDGVTENQPVITANVWNDINKVSRNRSLLIDALSKNLLIFVMNFVKLDIDFTILFGPNHTLPSRNTTCWSYKYHYLEELYSDAKRRNYDPLYLLDQINPKLTFTEEKHLLIVLQKLVGSFMNPFYHDQLQFGLNSRKKEEKEEDTDRENTDAEYIFRDLFLWCVLTYRLDMAEIFLSQMRTRICSALIASKILKSLAAYAPDQAAKDVLFSKASYFETHAVEFVRCAYANDKYQACELIMRRVNLYGGVTCLQMAIAADDKRFLYEDACQALLTNIWYDKLDPVRERNRLIMNIFTMGISQFFISIYDKCSSNRLKIKQKSHATTITSERPKRQFEKNGINYTDDYDINQSILQHFIHFHNRPVVKYYYTCFGYVLFLGFFSYFMLCAFTPPAAAFPSIHWTEILTIITVTTMLFEELRQVYTQEDRSLLGKIREYFDLKNRISNIFLVLPSYLLFYIGLILRFTQKDLESFTLARIVMALDLELWYIRSIIFIGISSQLGPKIVMIRKMTNDLSLFLIVIVVFIFGYGITSRSLMANSNVNLNSRQFVYDVIYPVYYFVHGSFDNERTALEAKQDANTFIVAKIMFVFHMLFVNILLINLLIALFSFTINDIQTQAHYVWAYDRCEIVRTYHNRPALFPPFTFLISMIQCGRWCWRKLCRNRDANRKFYDDDSSYFKMIPMNEHVDHAWSQFERYSTNSYIRQLLDDRAAAFASGTNTDIVFESSTVNSDELKRIKYLIADLQTNLEETNRMASEKLVSMQSAITDLQSRFEQMETRSNQWFNNMDAVKTSLNWMMKTMLDAKMTQSEPPIIQETPERTSSNQRQKHENRSYRIDQQRNREHERARRSPAQSMRSRSQSPASDTRIEMERETIDNRDT